MIEKAETCFRCFVFRSVGKFLSFNYIYVSHFTFNSTLSSVSSSLKIKIKLNSICSYKCCSSFIFYFFIFGFLWKFWFMGSVVEELLLPHLSLSLSCCDFRFFIIVWLCVYMHACMCVCWPLCFCLYLIFMNIIMSFPPMENLGFP